MGINVRTIVILLIIIFFTYFTGKLIATAPPLMPIALVLAGFGAIVTFIKPEMGLLILIFSMFLSPEIKLAELPKIPGVFKRELPIRIDDLLLIAIFFTWIVRITVRRELGLLTHTAVNRPIVIYILIFVVSTILAMMRGEVKPVAIFYLLRYIEYFMLFFMVVNLVHTEKQIKTYLKTGLLVCIIVGLYAYYQIGKVPRVTAPFEAAISFDEVGLSPGKMIQPGGREERLKTILEQIKESEPASLGGYLLIVMGLTFGLFLYADTTKRKILLMGLFFFLIPPFIMTLSRASYGAFIFLYLSLILLTRKRKIFLVGLTLLFIVLYPIVFPRLQQAMIERIRYTLTGYEPGFEYLGRAALGPLQYRFEPSTALRVRNWMFAFTKWIPKHPLIGHGVTGVGLVDAQYPLLLGEVGLIGFIVWWWMIITLFRHTWNVYTTGKDNFMRGLGLGYLAVLVGILVQGIGVNTFIIVRIMEPFWFLTGIMMKLPQIVDLEPQEVTLEKPAVRLPILAKEY